MDTDAATLRVITKEDVMILKTAVFVIFLWIFSFSQDSVADVIEQKSLNGTFVVQLQVKPDPPRMGINNTAILIVYERDSKVKVEGALIEVTPWMTVHSHGSSKKAKIKEKGDGVYTIEDVYFTMEGEWDLIVKIAKNKQEDQVVFTFRNVKK